jgi:hypothetical protein
MEVSLYWFSFDEMGQIGHILYKFVEMGKKMICDLYDFRFYIKK